MYYFDLVKQVRKQIWTVSPLCAPIKMIIVLCKNNRLGFR